MPETLQRYRFRCTRTGCALIGDVQGESDIDGLQESGWPICAECGDDLERITADEDVPPASGPHPLPRFERTPDHSRRLTVTNLPGKVGDLTNDIRSLDIVVNYATEKLECGVMPVGQVVRPAGRDGMEPGVPTAIEAAIVLDNVIIPSIVTVFRPDEPPVDAVFVIRADSEDGWWSNKDGWVGKVTEATKFDDLPTSIPASAEQDAKVECRCPVCMGNNLRLSDELPRSFKHAEFDPESRSITASSDCQEIWYDACSDLYLECGDCCHQLDVPDDIAIDVN